MARNIYLLKFDLNRRRTLNPHRVRADIYIISNNVHNTNVSFLTVIPYGSKWLIKLVRTIFMVIFIPFSRLYIIKHHSC